MGGSRPARASGVFSPGPVSTSTTGPSARADAPLAHQVLHRRHRRAPRGLAEDPGGPGQQAHAVQDLVVLGRRREAPRGQDGRPGVRGIARIADGQRAGDGAWLLDQHRLVPALADHPGDGRAARRLDAVHPARPRRHQTQLGQLLQALVKLVQQRAACHGHHHVGRQPPPQLLADLVAHGLRSLGVERLEVHVDEPPAAVVGQLAGQAVGVVVAALHGDHLGAVDGRAQQLGRLQVRRHQHHHRHPQRRRQRRQRVGQVAGRGAGHRGQAQRPRLHQRRRHHPVLERQGRVADRLVLHPQLVDAQRARQAIGAHQRGPSRMHPMSSPMSGAWSTGSSSR